MTNGGRETQRQRVDATGTVYDAAGPAGTAMHARLTPEQRAQYPASLDLWLVDCPGYHPCWSHYVCSLCHLRPIATDPRPVQLHYPDAQYEITVFAATTPNAPSDHLRWFETVLNPVNLVHQFHGVSDDGARAILARLVHAFVDGRCSADTDFRRLQTQLLNAWVADMRAQS